MKMKLTPNVLGTIMIALLFYNSNIISFKKVLALDFAVIEKIISFKKHFFRRCFITIMSYLNISSTLKKKS